MPAVLAAQIIVVIGDNYAGQQPFYYVYHGKY